MGVVEKQHVAFGCENEVTKVTIEHVIFVKEKVEILHGINETEAIVRGAPRTLPLRIQTEQKSPSDLHVCR